MIVWRSGACWCEAVTGQVEGTGEVVGWDAVSAQLGGPRRLGGSVVMRRVRDGLGGKMDVGKRCGGAWIWEIAICVDNGMVVSDGESS